jgi:transposase
MPQARTLDRGLDVQKDAIAVADVAQERAADVIARGPSGTRHADRDTPIRTLPSKANPLVLVYAAGPWGAWLSRSLPKQGHRWWVVAPASMPTKPGDRLPTDRRAAVPRARSRRAGELPPVSVPPLAEDARRHCTRARDDTSRDRQAAPCRPKAFLCRQALRAPGRAPWRPAPRRGRSEVVCPTPAPPSVCQADGRAVNAPPARRRRVAPARHVPVASRRVPPVAAALQARRGGPAPWRSPRWPHAARSRASLRPDRR